MIEFQHEHGFVCTMPFSSFSFHSVSYNAVKCTVAKEDKTWQAERDVRNPASTVELE
jgi:hypothetical protein